jgi:asparagine N-glycosylation enzyme membrane subunit Stt3
MVPEGTQLLSANKSVTGSDDFPIIGELYYITDGDKEAGEGYFVELMDGLQWVQIDLEEPADLSAIWVWHYHSQARAYHDIVVQVSNDPTFGSGVTTLFNNDYDNSAEQGKGASKPYVDSRYGKLIDAKGNNAQYVRLYSNGNTANDMNHYIEVEVYGK